MVDKDEEEEGRRKKESFSIKGEFLNELSNFNKKTDCYSNFLLFR